MTPRTRAKFEEEKRLLALEADGCSRTNDATSRPNGDDTRNNTDIFKIDSKQVNWESSKNLGSPSQTALAL